MGSKNEYAIRRSTRDRVVTLAIFKTKEEAFDQRLNIIEHILDSSAPNKVEVTCEWDTEYNDTSHYVHKDPQGTKACYSVETVTDRTNK